MNLQQILADHAIWLSDGTQHQKRANLSGLDLGGADLSGADLSGATLLGTVLRGTTLYMAKLRGAELRGANLQGADLRGADLTNARLPHFQICPETGGFIAYKKLMGGVVATLYIPPDAKRTSSLVGRKCRAEFVYVIDGAEYSIHDRHTRYEPGSMVYPDRYDDDIRVECAPGIHFFMTRREAEEYT